MSYKDIKNFSNRVEWAIMKTDSLTNLAKFEKLSNEELLKKIEKILKKGKDEFERGYYGVNARIYLKSKLCDIKNSKYGREIFGSVYDPELVAVITNITAEQISEMLNIRFRWEKLRTQYEKKYGLHPNLAKAIAWCRYQTKQFHYILTAFLR